MQKTYFTIVILFTSFYVICQNYSGEYISNKTTFKSEVNPKSNFNEYTRFNIAVLIQNDNKDGRIVIQDPKTPGKLLTYKVLNLEKKSNDSGFYIAIYECFAEHINKKEKVIFYSNDKGLRLVLSNNNSTQVFHNLKKLN